ncbi:MAG: DNA polymerase III subunit delta [Desulfofustis sp.]|nr:DNA polymerase III subunit delta [Desulfofustis sp.]
MAVHDRSDLSTILDEIVRGTPRPVYLCCGERYLCQQAAGQIEQAFLEHGSGTCHVIDGAAEDTSRMLSRLQSLSLLPGWQIYRISDSRLFLSRNVGPDLWDKACRAHQDNKTETAARYLAQLLALAALSSEEAGIFSALSGEHWQTAFGFARPTEDLSWADEIINRYHPPVPTGSNDATEKLIAAIEKGFPGRNVLLLLAETVDKRKRLYAAIKKYGQVIDCGIAEGASRAAQDQQKHIVRELAVATLKEFGKTIEPQVLEHLFERIGCHPVAVVRETEKLALFADELTQITRADLDLLVGRTREEAIFELSEALAARKAAQSLIILHHLLRDGIHALAIIATLRNFLRRLLIFRSLQLLPQPVWSRSMSSAQFQNSYLPALKETGRWPDLLKGHPYALFMSFVKAADWSPSTLKRSLTRLMEAEFRLKGTPLPAQLILEEMLVSMISPAVSPTATR